MVSSGVKVFEVDPDLIDRGTNAHIDTQNTLRNAIVAAGLVPLSPAASDPQFDAAWVDGDAATVAEVKSLTDLNEERQLRLGLGQVLRYRHDLDWDAVTSVQAVLAVEREPTDRRWIEVCEENGVALVWPATFASLF